LTFGSLPSLREQKRLILIVSMTVSIRTITPRMDSHDTPPYHKILNPQNDLVAASRLFNVASRMFNDVFYDISNDQILRLA